MGARGNNFWEGMAQMGASEVCAGEDGAAGEWGEAGAAVVSGAIEGESEKDAVDLDSGILCGSGRLAGLHDWRKCSMV
jgi:hypothetical protein